jgi:hypothetical protein
MLMKIEQLQLQTRQRYRRRGLTEAEIDERFEKQPFELLEFRQKWRRAGWSEERIDRLVKKLQDNHKQFREHLRNMPADPRPLNRRKIWPAPQEVVFRVQLEPCANCGRRPLLRKEWWTWGFGGIELFYHVLKCSTCKRTLTTNHDWRPYYVLSSSVPVKYREYSRLQIIGRWKAWNSPRSSKTATCPVQDTHRLRDKMWVTNYRI